ncbi:hypothetical protein [Flavobacterium difficile]|uniref:Uncharacterized protein n=1 Tax=Flavobacterium difficile TaxID=2709659 RepID=A0ABX0I6T6_9FLAO|nr:hypothetical protein [Flavobacterium difficile]NHM02827.1 hypothetical protein [Flavobacterium difficile]
MKGQVYELTDSEQKIQLNFLTDNDCRIEQSYLCEKLPDTFSNLTMEAKYRVKKLKIKHSGNKHLNVNCLIIENSDLNAKKLPRFTYIAEYENLCLPKVIVNSNEYKLRRKMTPGIILNLVRDSLVLRKDTIVFGYKKIPRKL